MNIKDKLKIEIEDDGPGVLSDSIELLGTKFLRST